MVMLYIIITTLMYGRAHRMKKKYEIFFDKLYIDNYSNLLKYAYRLTNMKNIAEEILQDAYSEAYRKIEVLYKHENPVGWLYIAVKNISKAYLREIIDMNKRLSLDTYELATTDEVSHEIFLQNYLSKEEADILLKFYVNRLTLLELSEEYAISLSACKMRLKRTREKFFKKYQNDY